MKIKRETRQAMLAAISEYFKSQPPAKEGHLSKVDVFKTSNPYRNAVWFKVWASKHYPDDNANVAKNEKGDRLFKKDPDWEQYPCGSTGDTLDTALAWVAKNL